MNKITVSARLEELDQVLDFTNDALDEYSCDRRARLQILIAVEEIFVNIVKYAFSPDEGTVEIRFSFNDAGKMVLIQFIDSGIPFDPLKNETPDLRLSCNDRKIGGLGIHIVKKSMDTVLYDYKDSKNILTIIKKLYDDNKIRSVSLDSQELPYNCI